MRLYFTTPCKIMRSMASAPVPLSSQVTPFFVSQPIQENNS